MKKHDKQEKPRPEENQQPQEGQKKMTPPGEAGLQQKQKMAEYDDLWDKYLRLQAEFDNYKKRSFKEKTEFVKFANEGLIMELLGILDDFERGVKAAEKKHDFSLLHQGVDMISRQLHSLLEGKGLTRIKSVGEVFNPHLHEPLDVIEDEKATEEKVIEELQPGYSLNGRIIRPAKVKVVRPKSQSPKESEVSESQPSTDDRGDESNGLGEA
jgi:molecular chaperone GrpE